MSALPARAATAGSLALALALALPAAALADEEQERGRSASAPQSADDRREDRSATGDQRSADQGSGDQGRSAGAPYGQGGSDGSSTRSRAAEAQGDDAGRSGEGRAAGGDPRGNNGTVKIDGEAFDDGRGNEPHVGCVFQVDFYGFDAGDTATITLTGQAPTGGGLLHSETATLISADAAGGGQDRDATITYSVDDQLSELRSIAPHPQQGWHVKLAVDVDSAPGGAKQKVLWIACPAAAAAGEAATGSATTDSATSDSVSPAGTVGTQSLGAGTATVLPTAVSGTTVASAVRQDELTLGSGTATLASGAAQGVAARGAMAPAALPFTGAQALSYLLALGASAVGVGAAAHRLGRRRAEIA